MTPRQRAEADHRRTVLHDAFMARLDPLCRILELDTTLLPDRQAKGGLACCITLFLGLENR